MKEVRSGVDLSFAANEMDQLLQRDKKYVCLL